MLEGKSVHVCACMAVQFMFIFFSSLICPLASLHCRTSLCAGNAAHPRTPVVGLRASDASSVDTELHSWWTLQYFWQHRNNAGVDALSRCGTVFSLLSPHQTSAQTSLKICVVPPRRNLKDMAANTLRWLAS